MSKQLELIVFDWDGTLMDSAARIVSSLRAASADLDLPLYNDATYRNVIGLGLREAIDALGYEFNQMQTNLFAERYRHYFLVACPLPEMLFEGVVELLQTLEARGKWLAVATGKSRKGLDRALQQTNCRNYFHTTRCADETCSKPDPQMLREIMEELGVDPQQTLMIGDTEYDMEMAQRAGTASLAVGYGAHEAHRLLKYDPLACLDSVTALEHWLVDNT